MYSVILAGGQGSRLRPLTCGVPKPLVTLCSKPVLEYILELLAENGCDRAVITLGYLGGQIERYFGGAYSGISLEYAHEKTPLGTAGSVRAAMNNAEEDFIVISGDAVCDFDLAAAYRYHVENKAAATIIARKVDDPREYGLLRAENGIVTGFCEKPSFHGCTDELANTGIYILSPSVLKLIPENTLWDFAGKVFPQMLKSGMKLLCFEESGYWCDIGDIQAYMRCHRDMLDGKIKLPRKKLNIAGGSFISPDTSVGKTAVINDGCVICENASVGNGSRINGSIVLRGAYIGENVTLNNCIIGENARLEYGCSVFENAVVGDDCLIGENAVICSGVKIWHGKHIPDNSSVNRDVKNGCQAVPLFDDYGISGETNTVITPELAARLGSAAASLSRSGITVASEASGCGAALRQAFAAGAAATGTVCYNTESGRLPVIIHTARLCRSDIIAVISSGAKTSIRIYAEGGLPLTRVQERMLEGAFFRSEYKTASWRDFGSIVSVTGANALYTAMLRKLLDFGCGYRLTVSGTDEATARLAESVGKGTAPLKIRISPDGSKASVYDENGCIADHSRLLLLGLIGKIGGESYSLPYDFPAAADRVAREQGRRLYRFYETSNDDSDLTARKIAAEEQFLFDGLYLTLAVLRFLSEEKMTLRAAIKLLPNFGISDRMIRISCPPQRILSKISGERSCGGITINDGDGVVRARSNKNGNGIFVYAESTSSETANELCFKTELLINRIMQKNDNIYS